MRKIFYDIMPPKKIRRRKTWRKRSGARSPVAGLCFIIILALNWAGISAMGRTAASLFDTENSAGNVFTAGTLDFQLSSDKVFSNTALMPGELAEGEISLINLSNIPKYKVKAADFTGGLCEYLDLEANLDEGDIEYSGKLTELDFGPTVFEDPDDWKFVLSLPSDASEDLIGETCNFNFVFYGSQTRNDLLFGLGFSDEEGAGNDVTAKICFDTETKSKGYWKNHSEVYEPYLPLNLGNEIVNNISDVDRILQTEYSSSMLNKLEGQLLAMKFNIVHFGVGDYLVESEGKTINKIADEADELLKLDPEPSDKILEAMKDLLESLVDLQIRACKDSLIRVLIPNCGEVWWVGRHYDITWEDKNLVCEDGEIEISIWYSADSGTTFANIITNTADDGVYDWRVPLYLSGYYVPSAQARVKIIARCSSNNEILNWDMSDCDFCPPIDFSQLTPEEIEEARALGLLPPEISSEGENQAGDTTIEESVPPEETGGGGITIENPEDEAPEDGADEEEPASDEDTETIEEIPPAESENPPAEETEDQPPAETENTDGGEVTEDPADNSIPADIQEDSQQLTQDVATPEVISEAPSSDQSPSGSGDAPDGGTSASDVPSGADSGQVAEGE